MRRILKQYKMGYNVAFIFPRNNGFGFVTWLWQLYMKLNSVENYAKA